MDTAKPFRCKWCGEPMVIEDGSPVHVTMKDEILGDLVKDGAFAIPLPSHDSLSEALNIAIDIIRKSSPAWRDQVLRKYHFQIFPHDSSYGPPSFSASLMVSKKEGQMPWEKETK